jgi:hypothetical protein
MWTLTISFMFTLIETYFSRFIKLLMPGFWNGAITNWPVKSSVAIETLESNQSHYMIFVFNGELTNWPDKTVQMRPTLHFRKKLATEIKMFGFF